MKDPGKPGGSRETRRLDTIGRTLLRSGLAANLLWIGALKFTAYEAEGIKPMVASSPLLSWAYKRMDVRRTARLLGSIEVTLGTLIAIGALSPTSRRAPALGSLGAIAMFGTTLSFLISMPESWQEGYGFPALSPTGQFVLKDSVLLGAAIVTAAESLQPPDGARRATGRR